MIPQRTQSQEVLALQERYLFPAVHPYYADHPLIVDRAKGHTVWDVEGNAYLDFFGGVLTVSVGHCNDEVTRRVGEQLHRVQHTSTLYVNEVMARLAEKVAAITPGRLQKCFFTSSGSEANETAVTAARMATGNRTVVTLRHAYSGRTMEAMSLTAHGPWRLGGTFDGDVRHVRSPYAYRAPVGLDEERLVDLCVQDLEETLATVTDGRIAAFMAEPIQGVGGFVVLPRDYLRRIEPLVREAGGLLIIDEVQTGWGRTGGTMCAVEHWGVTPDIMTFAKGMANGAPIGCTVATPEVADAMTGTTFSTFGGNPVSMAAALATIEIIERENLPDNAHRQGLRLRMRLEEACEAHGFVGEVRGMGLMQGLEIVVPDGSKAPDAARADALLAAARERGLLIGKGGLHNNVIRIAPHLDVDAKEIDDGCGRLAQALAAIA
ncbi:MAG TPA: aspartate aminotransferase family protein [Trueperaceae bacterium]|nr:aspartate aminotransferase family protein [Trueperaceae bacterium]